MNLRAPLLALASLLAACGGGSGKVSYDEAKPVLQAYAANLHQMYSDAVDDENAFATTVSAFLAAPSAATLDAARTAWLASRAHYMLSESGRFYGGPIDVAPPDHEGSLNSWPLDEAYVDYTTDATGKVDDTTGIVNNPSTLPTITVAGIDMLNAQGGDTNISDGYHAIEFLLWGQALMPIGPGDRPYTDYLASGPRPNSDRRATYLSVATQGVIEHLTAVRDAWAPGADYRSQFESGEVAGTSSLALVLTGLGRFSKGELANQRVDAPYESKARRDQHDCFSSETLVDYVRDTQGIVDLYTGAYGASTGPGIDSLIHKVDPAIASMLSAQVNASVAAMQAIPAPFEASIAGADSSPGRMAILATINSLRAQGDLFAQAASSLGLKILVPNDN